MKFSKINAFSFLSAIGLAEATQIHGSSLRGGTAAVNKEEAAAPHQPVDLGIDLHESNKGQEDAIMSLTNDSDTGHDLFTADFCWRETHTRAISGVPTACGPGTQKIGLLCYENCPAGYFRWGLDCHQSCPAGFHDSGIYCKTNNPSAYLRSGFAWQWHDGWSNAGMFSRCEAAHGQGKCVQIGAIVYPQCSSGYTSGRGLEILMCYRNSPLNCGASGLSTAWNIIDVKNLCPRNIQLGKLAPLKCTHGEDSLGLCFNEPCQSGYEAAGAVCWVSPPPGWVRCGMGAAKDADKCGSITTSQVTAVTDVALNLLKLALAFSSGGVAVGALEFVKIVEKFNEFVNLYGSVQEIISDLKNSQYQEWIDIATANGDTTPADQLRVVAQIISIVDVTGLSGIVGSYSYPMCATV